jgi:peptide-methionine (S)-S-oxide reductase
MSDSTIRGISLLAIPVALVLLGAKLLSGGASVATPVPDPLLDAPRAAGSAEQTAVFAGGCFWGVEAVFEHLKGVKSAVSGYAGGSVASPDYETVSTGTTGHAESVRVVFDPAVVTYGDLLKVFFSVAHDPTQKNRQGPDVGTQYRSAIFYVTAEQKSIAEGYIKQLADSKTFARPIVTEVSRLKEFYPAESYHQDYLAHHPDQPYIVINDQPKVRNLQKQFPELWRN